MINSIGEKNSSLKWLSLAIWLMFSVTLCACSDKNQRLPEGSGLQTFNKEKWLTQSFNANESITIRQKMLGDLVENILPGMKKNEVYELLGNPVSEQANIIHYRTGRERTEYTIPIDNEYLAIFFNENNIYNKYSLYSN